MYPTTNVGLLMGTALLVVAEAGTPVFCGTPDRQVRVPKELQSSTVKGTRRPSLAATTKSGLELELLRLREAPLREPAR